MELRFAFFALNAGQTEDGELWCAGIDFDRISAAALPLPIQFHLVVKLTVTPADREAEHVFSVAMTSPAGERSVLMDNHQINLGAPNEADPRRSTNALILVRVGRSFAQAGEHRFHVGVDGREVKTLPLNVDVAPGL